VAISKEKFKQTEFIEALRTHECSLTELADLLGVKEHTVYLWLSMQDHKYRDEVRAIRKMNAEKRKAEFQDLLDFDEVLALLQARNCNLRDAARYLGETPPRFYKWVALLPASQRLQLEKYKCIRTAVPVKSIETGGAGPIGPLTLSIGAQTPFSHIDTPAK
jgi:hypothetical protein